MKYQAPVGAADPDDPYIDGNPNTGTEGSPVPAAAIEDPQREIMVVIEQAGLDGDEEDLTQLFQALQILFGSSNHKIFVCDDGGAANAYDLTVAGGFEPPEELDDGVVVIFKAANASSGASTIDLEGIGAESFTLPDGTAISDEIEAGAYVIATYRSDDDRYELIFCTGQSGSLAEVLHVQDQKSSGTNGGTASGGSWNQRTLNTVITNNIAGASLSSNKITLPEGTHEIQIVATAEDIRGHQLRLYNVTDAAVELATGISQYCNDSYNGSNLASLKGIVTLASSKELRLDHYIQGSNTTTDLGHASNSGAAECYAEIFVRKLG